MRKLSCTAKDIITNIHDIIGFKVVCIDEKVALDFIKQFKQEIGKMDNVEITSISDRFAEPKPSGYRGYKINLVFNIPMVNDVQPIIMEVIVSAQQSKIRKQPISFFSPLSLGFRVAQMVKNCLQCRRPGFDPWFGTIPWRRAWQPTPVFLPGESHGQKSLVGYSPSGHKKTDTTERLSTAQFFSCEHIPPSHVVVSTTI